MCNPVITSSLYLLKLIFLKDHLLNFLLSAFISFTPYLLETSITAEVWTLHAHLNSYQAVKSAINGLEGFDNNFLDHIHSSASRIAPQLQQTRKSPQYSVHEEPQRGHILSPLSRFRLGLETWVLIPTVSAGRHFGGCTDGGRIRRKARYSVGL